ncbi:MAG: Sensor protein FixL [Planctomycetota bacterium]|jgi:signal transduction histidine kinase
MKPQNTGSQAHPGLASAEPGLPNFLNVSKDANGELHETHEQLESHDQRDSGEQLDNGEQHHSECERHSSARIRRLYTELDVLESIQAECERIARELHDAAGQELAAAGLFAAGLQKLVVRALRRAQRQQLLSASQVYGAGSSDGCGVWFDAAETGQLQETITGIRRGLAAAARSVRDLSHGLLLTELDPSELPARLEELRETLEIARSVHCEVRCLQPGEPGYQLLNSERALQLLRIVQEAVSNAIRHSGADEIRVSLSGSDGHIELEVADNGRGIADEDNGYAGKDNGHTEEDNGHADHVAESLRCGGIGLRNMAYRARRIGGLLHVSCRSSGGTVVRCRVEPGDGEHG